MHQNGGSLFQDRKPSRFFRLVLMLRAKGVFPLDVSRVAEILMLSKLYQPIEVMWSRIVRQSDRSIRSCANVDLVPNELVLSNEFSVLICIQ